MSSDIKKLSDENIALHDQIKNLTEEKQKISTNLDNASKEKILFLTQINSLKEDITKLINEKQNLNEQLSGLKKERPSIKINDVALMITNSLQSIEDKLLQSKKDGYSYFVDKFEIEMKSGIDATDGLSLVQPTIKELTPESLSTVRMSLKSRPKITIASEQDD